MQLPGIKKISRLVLLRSIVAPAPACCAQQGAPHFKHASSCNYAVSCVSYVAATAQGAAGALSALPAEPERVRCFPLVEGLFPTVVFVPGALLMNPHHHHQQQQQQQQHSKQCSSC
jgi:hypothetical protein